MITILLSLVIFIGLFFLIETFVTVILMLLDVTGTINIVSIDLFPATVFIVKKSIKLKKYISFQIALKKHKNVIKNVIRTLKDNDTYISYRINFDSDLGIKYRKGEGLPIDFNEFIIYLYANYHSYFASAVISRAFNWNFTKEQAAYWYNTTKKIEQEIINLMQ